MRICCALASHSVTRRHYFLNLINAHSFVLAFEFNLCFLNRFRYLLHANAHVSIWCSSSVDICSFRDKSVLL